MSKNYFVIKNKKMSFQTYNNRSKAKININNLIKNNWLIWSILIIRTALALTLDENKAPIINPNNINDKELENTTNIYRNNGIFSLHNENENLNNNVTDFINKTKLLTTQIISNIPKEQRKREKSLLKDKFNQILETKKC